jgi:hypothetical protein
VLGAVRYSAFSVCATTTTYCAVLTEVRKQMSSLLRITLCLGLHAPRRTTQCFATTGTTNEASIATDIVNRTSP